MADTLTLNGLSIGPIVSADTSAIPTVIPAGSRPVDQINRAAAALQQVSLLQYPLDLPKYYMGFKIMSYKRNDLLSVAQTTTLNQVCLPFADQLLDTYQVAYDKKDFSSFIGNAINSAWPIGQQIGNNISQGKEALTGVTKDQAAKFNTDTTVGAGLSALNGLTGGAGQAVLGAAGWSPNYFLTVILSGPQYKQYTLQWTFAPRSPQESAALAQIIRVFKDAQAPGLALGGALFSFPRVFQNYFGPDRGFLYQFKPSILMNFTANYTGAGIPSMKQNTGDSVLNGWHAPSVLRIQASFMELEFWLRGDFGDVSQGAPGAQENSNSIVPVVDQAARSAD